MGFAHCFFHKAHSTVFFPSYFFILVCWGTTLPETLGLVQISFLLGGYPPDRCYVNFGRVGLPVTTWQAKEAVAAAILQALPEGGAQQKNVPVVGSVGPC